MAYLIFTGLWKIFYEIQFTREPSIRDIVRYRQKGSREKHEGLQRLITCNLGIYLQADVASR